MNAKRKNVRQELDRIKADAKLEDLAEKKLGYFIILVDIDSGWSGANSNMNEAGLIQILLNYCKQRIVKIGD